MAKYVNCEHYAECSNGNPDILECPAYCEKYVSGSCTCEYKVKKNTIIVLKSDGTASEEEID